MTCYPTKPIRLGTLTIGGDAPVSVQSMTFTETRDVDATVDQINRLAFAGAQIVRVAVPEMEDAKALEAIRSRVGIPVVADIHFNYRLALEAAKWVDAIRINPGNIGSKDRIKAVVEACQARSLPIRIGVNCGSLERPFEEKYGQSAEAMVQSALYNIGLLEDLGFDAIKVSMKASDALRTVAAYRQLRPLVPYPFHLGVTEAGTLFHSTVKSSVALGALLMEGIGDTLRVCITGELEQEIVVGRAILKATGHLEGGVNIVSCPTCGRLEADLTGLVGQIEAATAHLQTPLTLSVMGCAVNALGEAKGADAAIAFGKGEGLIIAKGEILGKYPESELLPRFLTLVETLEHEAQTPKD